MKEPGKAEHEFLLEALQGNLEAVDFCERIFYISQVLDDLVDRDNEVDDATIVRAFRMALFEIPMNMFFNRNSYRLLPLLDGFLTDWWDATRMEKLGGDQLAAAFALRDTVGSIITHCADIIGGWEHSRAVSLKMRVLIHNEPFEQYQREHSP